MSTNMAIVSPTRQTRSRNRSNTILATQDILPQESETIVHKDYSLNRQAALAKKQENCYSDNQTCEMKLQNNLVVKCSTAAFEFAK